ncbi:hypothetical protein COZ97_01700, partial [bacterium CG_4_8_14_3_um_filter_33_28]
MTIIEIIVYLKLMFYNCITMAYTKRQKAQYLIFFLIIVFIVVISFKASKYSFPTVNFGKVADNEAGELYIDPSLEVDISQLLNDHSDDIKFTKDKNKADIFLSENKDKNLETIDNFNEFYVPVTGFFNNIQGLHKTDIEKILQGEFTNWQQLGGEDLQIKTILLESEEYKNIIRKFSPNLKESIGEKFSKIDTLVTKIAREKNYFSIIPLRNLAPPLRVVSIDGISSLEDETQDNYPFKLNYHLQSKKELSDRELKILNIIKQYIVNRKNGIIEVDGVGDIMLSRHVNTKIADNNDDALPFRKLYRILSSADFTFANLESPFYNKGSVVKEGMVFKAEPKTIEGLKLSGIDLVSLANNHFGNQGRVGMNFTYDHLKNNGISYFGAGRDFEQAHSPLVIEKGTNKLSFLSYDGIAPESYKASEKNSGFAWISSEEKDLKQMENDIKNAKKKSDLVIISFHWGVEYMPDPNKEQINIAKRAIQSGADIIISQHPHVVQGINMIDNKFVAFSLGNFVFDQMWSEETREGVIAKLYIKNKKILNVALVPIKIEDYNQPRLANSVEAKKIL